ncbi:MAG: KEOPS complex Pcc1-like subunit [Candidatus Diapherotrites archaeon]|nr:KEOPS complex Pcc1-like subunit [Candidatus Diapherotrites archaeon]
METSSFTLSAVFENPETASVVFEALSPETGGRHEKRSSTTLSRHGKIVVVAVSALDKKALRASINSYLKLFDLSVTALEVI